MSVIERNEEQTIPTSDSPNVPLVKGTAKYSELISYADNCFSLCKRNRMQFERQWYLNIGFYFGKQNIMWSSEAVGPSGKLVDPPAPKWRVRLISNQIRRYVRKEYAKMIQESPTGYVVPDSNEDSDVFAARAGDSILDFLMRETKFKREMRWACFWASVCGNGFIKDWYNRADPEEDSMGDMPEIQAITPFHFYVPDVTNPDLERQPYCIQVSAKQVQWVNKTYGSDLKGEGTSSQGILEDKFLGAMGITEKMTKDVVYVKEAWFKPGGYFEKGAVVVWTDDTLLWFQEEYPFSHNEFPFTKIDHIATGRFYNESIITDLIPLQKELNRTRSQIIESKNRMAFPQLIAPKGSVDPRTVTSEPGIIIFYTPGFNPPVAAQQPGLPNYVIQELDRIKEDMDDISSQHEVSRGQAPPGVEAATAISYLQEQDDSVLSDVIFSIEQGTEKIGRHFLFYVNEYWDMSRKIQVVGSSSQFEAFEFSKANLKGNTDYVVQSGSAYPRSKAGKEAQITSWMDKGYLPPTLGFKYLDMNETSKIFEDMQIDVRHAQRENLKMSQFKPEPPPEIEPSGVDPEVEAFLGERGLIPPPVQPEPIAPPEFPANVYDNHFVHLQEHDNWRKRQEYEQATPEVRQLFETHIRLHKLYICTLYGIPVEMDIDPLQLDSIVFRLMNGGLQQGLDGSTQPVGSSTQSQGV